jgi:sorbitol-specific phosphotransferase system component IIBC
MARGMSDLIPEAATPLAIKQLTLRIDALRCAVAGLPIPLQPGAAAHNRL